VGVRHDRDCLPRRLPYDVRIGWFVVASDCGCGRVGLVSASRVAVVIEHTFVEQVFGADTPCVLGVTRVTLTLG
jgi:hypothetical protein